MNRFASLLLVLICLPAQAGPFEPQTFLDPPPEFLTDPEAPIATAPNGLVAHWHEGTIFVRKPTLVDQLATFRLSAKPTAMAFTHNDRFLVTGHADGTVHLIPVRQAATPTWTVRLKPGPIGSVSPHPASQFIAVTSNKKLVLLGMDHGKKKGELGIQRSASKGPTKTFAVFASSNQIGVLEKGRVTFVPTDRHKGLLVDGVRRVKLGKSGITAAPYVKYKGLFFASNKAIFLVGIKSKTPKQVVQTKQAGSPLRLTTGTLLLAALQKGKKRVALFNTNLGFKPAGEFKTRVRTIEQIALSWDDRFLYCALKREDGKARLDAIDASSASLRRGMLPDYALGLRFGPEGGLLCLSPRGEDTDKASVDRFRYDPVTDRLKRVGSHKGELIRHGETHFLLRAPDGALVFVARIDGGETTIEAPAELAEQLAYPRCGFVVFSDDEQHTVWDPKAGKALGVWNAPSAQHLAVTPDGKRFVTLLDRTLTCYDADARKLWETKVAQAGARVDLAADTAKVLVPEAGVHSLNDGEQLYALPPIGARFSSGGLRVLVDQNNRSREGARILGADSGKSQDSLRYQGKSARVRSGVELLDMGPQGRYLLLRQHGGEHRGLWIYKRTS